MPATKATGVAVLMEMSDIVIVLQMKALIAELRCQISVSLLCYDFLFSADQLCSNNNNKWYES
jgi:hypothetical protein